MEMVKINWNEVERIVATSFPDEYEMITQKQIKAIEQKICNGKTPYVHQQQTGGMHIDFGAAINVVAELMLATSIIVVWYDVVKPTKEELTYENLQNTLDKVPQIKDFIIALLTQEVLRTIERIFNQIIETLM